MGKKELHGGAVKDGLRRAAGAGQWESPNELYTLVAADARLKSLGFWDFLKQFRKDETQLRALRDTAAATKGSTRRGYVPPELDCPGRHWAVPFITWDEGFVCNLCEKSIKVGVTCLGCQLCNHDVCPDCVQRLRDTAKGTGATHALTSIGESAAKSEGSSPSAGTKMSRRKKKANHSATVGKDTDSGEVAAGVEDMSPTDGVTQEAVAKTSEHASPCGETFENIAGAQTSDVSDDANTCSAGQSGLVLDGADIPVGDSDDDL